MIATNFVVSRAFDVVGHERRVEVIDATQLRDRLVAEINAQIAARELVSAERQQTRQALTLLLPAGVAASFNRPEKAILECVSPARLVLFGNSVHYLLTGEHVAHCGETVTHDIAGPRQVFRLMFGAPKSSVYYSMVKYLKTPEMQYPHSKKLQKKDGVIGEATCLSMS